MSHHSDRMYMSCAGRAARPVQNMKCVSFRNAIHMIVDTPMRNVCEGFRLIKKILVTPYVPNPLDMKNPEAYLQLPYVPLAQRTNFVSRRAFPYLITCLSIVASIHKQTKICIVLPSKCILLSIKLRLHALHFSSMQQAHHQCQHVWRELQKSADCGGG